MYCIALCLKVASLKTRSDGEVKPKGSKETDATDVLVAMISFKRI